MVGTDYTPDNDGYRNHLNVVQARWDNALNGAGFDAVLIAAGRARPYFLDDQSPPFRANPHLAQWLGTDDCQHSLLLVEPGEQPRLFFYQPQDYWHQPPQCPDRVRDLLKIEIHSDAGALEAAAITAAQRLNHVAYVGEEGPGNLPVSDVNPAQLLSQLTYQRAYKTEFEVGCMRAATALGVAGHIAARDAFVNGASEFEIHLRFMAASGQSERETPYPSIVALNEHAGVLHYQHYDVTFPPDRFSFLIDAGARYQGYGCDITRTYGWPDSTSASETFARLIAGLNNAQLAHIASIQPGQSYVTLHEDMHRRIGRLLATHGLVNCSAEGAFDLGITRYFLPHGLGHLLGLQTHDVGGQQISPAGGQRPAPPEYPALRLTRNIETDQVFTIEPGLYFIPQLLDALRNGDSATRVNWSAVEALLPFGGIRIEDNILITDHGTENLTRDAFTSV